MKSNKTPLSFPTRVPTTIDGVFITAELREVVFMLPSGDEIMMRMDGERVVIRTPEGVLVIEPHTPKQAYVQVDAFV